MMVIMRTYLLLCYYTVMSAVTSCSAASSPFDVTSRSLSHSLARESKVLDIRGGGTAFHVAGFPISQENLAAAFVAFIGMNAAIAVPAPETLCKLYQIDATPGTVQYWILESMSYTGAGLAIMSYLAAFKDLDVVKTVAYGGGIPCTYFAYKELLKGTYKKMGASPGGAAVTAFMMGCMLLIFTGIGDTSLICRIFALPPVVTGFVGCFSPKAAAATWGLNLDEYHNDDMKEEGVRSRLNPRRARSLRKEQQQQKQIDLINSERNCIFYKWMSYNLLAWGVLAMTLLFGGVWTQAVGLASLIVCANIAESLFLSGAHKTIGVPDVAPIFVFSLTAFVSAGLLLSSDSLPPFVGV